MHAEKCPICLGTGEIAGSTSAVCKGCGGKGWIEVRNDVEPIRYPYPIPYVPCTPYYWWPDYTYPTVTYTT
jgi:hypothetical protein